MLKIVNIKKTFNPGTVNEVKALQGISLEIEDGSFVCVLGTNGSGKSTLLNAVAGTFIIDEGSIILDNNDITKWQEHKRAKLKESFPKILSAEQLLICQFRKPYFGY